MGSKDDMGKLQAWGSFNGSRLEVIPCFEGGANRFLPFVTSALTGMRHHLYGGVLSCIIW